MRNNKCTKFCYFSNESYDGDDLTTPLLTYSLTNSSLITRKESASSDRIIIKICVRWGLRNVLAAKIGKLKPKDQ
jgi:hypothetical protein